MMPMKGGGTAVMFIRLGLILMTAESQTKFCESDQCQTSWTPVPNMGAALVGYNPFLGNRLIPGQSDPGKRNQIFSPTTVGEDGRVNVNDFLHFSDAVNCQILDHSIVVRNYQEYQQQKSGSYSFARSFEETFGTNIPFFSLLVNFEKAKSSRRSSSGESSFEKEESFFSETQGEIYMNEARCETHRVAVDSFEKPVFTSAFITAMRALQQAATTPTSRGSKRILQRFIGGYGTHFMAETWLGATMITETKIASASESVADRRERQRCVREAYSKGLEKGVNVRPIDVTGSITGSYKAVGATVGASTTVGGWGINSGDTYSKESEKCGGSQQDLSIFDSNQFKQSVIHSVGSPPLVNVDEWAAQVGETPAAVRFTLKSIGSLFRPKWLGKIPLDEMNPAAGNLDADLLSNFFEESVAKYCEIVLGRPCPDAKGCGINGLCKIGEICFDDSSNSLGFKCGTGVKLHSDSQFDYFKIAVDSGVRMVSGATVTACRKYGLEAACNGPSGCRYTDETKCQVVPIETRCGNNMPGISKAVCDGEIYASECAELEGVFQYRKRYGSDRGVLGGNWQLPGQGRYSGGDRGVLGGREVAGKEHTSGEGGKRFFAYCVKAR